MSARIVPIKPLHDAVEAVLQAAADFVDAAHHRGTTEMGRAFLVLDAAVSDERCIRDAHASSITTPPHLAIVRGGDRP